MKTQNHGGALRKSSGVRGYSKGGFLDAIKSGVGMKTAAESQAARVAAMSAKTNAATIATKAAAPTPTASALVATAPQTGIGGYAGNSTLSAREKAAGLARGGAIKGPRGAMRSAASKKRSKMRRPPMQRPVTKRREDEELSEELFEELSEEMPGDEPIEGFMNGGHVGKKKIAEGAKLKGPGTPTSDSIPAKVVDTGEPIKVATGERIVSKKQDAFLLKQAQDAGYATIDEWLEAGTGHPVGPTLKYTPEGKMPHASGGGRVAQSVINPIRQINAADDTTGDATRMGFATGGEIDLIELGSHDTPGQTRSMTSRASYGLSGIPLMKSDVFPKGFATGGKIAQGGTPYDIPGYTPGTIQRAGYGLPGNPMMQGQAVSVPKREGDVTFKRGGAVRRKMMPGRGSDPHGIRLGAPVAGYFGGGELGQGDAVTRLNAFKSQTAGGPMPTLQQIAAATAPPSAPAIAATPSEGATGSWAQKAPGAAQPGVYDDTYRAAADGRQQIAEASKTGRTSDVIGHTVRGMGAVGGAMAMDTAKAIGGVLRPVGNALSIALKGEGMGSAPPASQQAPTKPVAGPVSTGQYGPPAPGQATTPESTDGPAILAGNAGRNVGNGVTRFDVAGKSPLFTNMVDASGMTSNEALVNRGPVSAQNQQALNGLLDRQAKSNAAGALRSQYDAEVAGAKAINSLPLPTRTGAEKLVDLTSAENQAISNLTGTGRFGVTTPANARLIGEIVKQTFAEPRTNQATETTRRGQDIQARGQDIQAQGNTNTNQLAQQRLGLDVNADQRAATASGFQVRQQQRLETLQTRYESAKGPAREAIAEELRALTGKQGESAKDRYLVTGGGQETGPDGMNRTLPQRIFDTQKQQYIDQGGGAVVAPPQQAVAMLKSNPGMAAQFDAKYGAGAAARTMGQK